MRKIPSILALAVTAAFLGCAAEAPPSQEKTQERFLGDLENMHSNIARAVQEGKAPEDAGKMVRQAHVLVQRCKGTPLAADAEGIEKSVNDLDDALAKKEKDKITAALEKLKKNLDAFKAKQK